MVLTVGVVERATIRRVGYALVADVGISTVVHAHALRLDIALEACLVAADSEREELLRGIIGLNLELKGVATITGSKVGKCLGIVRTTCIDRF